LKRGGGRADHQYRPVTPNELPNGYKYGITFTSYTLDTPNYLVHLGATLRAKGVPIIRQRVSSLDEAYCMPSLGPVPLIINATGLGSQTLLGVEDAAVFPARGQTVTVKAPSVRTNMGIKDPHPQNDRGQRFYIIPRPGPEGHVTLGGTFIANDYSTLPDPQTAERILRETYELCPALAEGREGGWRGIEVVSHNVGLRPCRHGGMRLELEQRKIGQGMEGREGMVPPAGRQGVGRSVGCVHAYGIGPAG
jgi:D-amino-acid oxidase